MLFRGIEHETPEASALTTPPPKTTILFIFTFLYYSPVFCTAQSFSPNVHHVVPFAASAASAGAVQVGVVVANVTWYKMTAQPAVCSPVPIVVRRVFLI